MEADESDGFEAVSQVDGTSGKTKRHICESTISASTKLWFRSPGPGGRVTSSAAFLPKYPNSQRGAVGAGGDAVQQDPLFFTW
eukprot:4411439-Pyramimonas_sp.AAC.1